MDKNDSKRYYWLKLDRNFFKRHDIRIIESMDNGKDYILFYLKLLCESTTHNGELRFSETVPYNEQMLSTITNTNIDIVRSAIKVFESLKMMEILDDGTIYIQMVNKMIGSETGQTIRKREALLNKVVNSTTNIPPQLDVENIKKIDIEKEKEQENIGEELGKREGNIHLKVNITREIDKEKELEKDKDKESDKDLDIYKNNLKDVYLENKKEKLDYSIYQPQEIITITEHINIFLEKSNINKSKFWNMFNPKIQNLYFRNTTELENYAIGFAIQYKEELRKGN